MLQKLKPTDTKTDKIDKKDLMREPKTDTVKVNVCTQTTPHTRDQCVGESLWGDLFLVVGIFDLP